MGQPGRDVQIEPSRQREQPVQRPGGGNSLGGQVAASVAEAVGEGRSGSDEEGEEDRAPDWQGLAGEEYNFFNCGKICINTHKFIGAI